MLRAGWALGTWDTWELGATGYLERVEKIRASRGGHARAKETPHKKIGVNGIMIYWGAVAVAPGTDGDLAPPDSRLSTPEARRGRA